MDFWRSSILYSPSKTYYLNIMMTTLALTLAMVASTQSQETPVQQPQIPAIPKQLDELNFMLGTWEGMGTGMGADGSPIQLDGTATASKQMDRWIQWDSTDNIPGKGMMTGRFMLTYNTMQNQWEGVWFDNQSPFATDFTGTFDGTSLVLTSESVPDMTGTGSSQYTVTFAKKSDNEITMKLESTMAGKNATMIDYLYTKR